VIAPGFLTNVQMTQVISPKQSLNFNRFALNAYIHRTAIIDQWFVLLLASNFNPKSCLLILHVKSVCSDTGYDGNMCVFNNAGGIDNYCTT